MRAQRGMSEEKCTPGMAVGILETPAGRTAGLRVPGFELAWAPHRKSKITFFCERRAACAKRIGEITPEKLVTPSRRGRQTLEDSRRCRRCSSGLQAPGCWTGWLHRVVNDSQENSGPATRDQSNSPAACPDPLTDTHDTCVTCGLTRPTHVIFSDMMLP